MSFYSGSGVHAMILYGGMQGVHKFMSRTPERLHFTHALTRGMIELVKDLVIEPVKDFVVGQLEAMLTLRPVEKID